jgi:hypothetical protein
MDANVIAAMARWPDVSDVYGWMSLTESGQWRLHPRGDAWQFDTPAVGRVQNYDDSHVSDNVPAGETITSPQILRFIDRNYTCDKQGQWFFQNGPQKVYVRLDAAPYILHTVGGDSAGKLCLRTHNGLNVETVAAWWLDDTGKLYAQTEHGPGLIAGRDLAAVLDCLRTPEGLGIFDVLGDPFEHDRRDAVEVLALVSDYAPSALIRPTELKILLTWCTATEIPRRLEFVRQPKPVQGSAAAPAK